MWQALTLNIRRRDPLGEIIGQSRCGACGSRSSKPLPNPVVVQNRASTLLAVGLYEFVIVLHLRTKGTSERVSSLTIAVTVCSAFTG